MADVRLWCRICGSPSGSVGDRAVADGAGVPAGAGLRTYQTKVIPGHLQTPVYMTGILTAVRRERDVETDDVADAVAERLSRQDYMRRTDRQFRFVIEEPVLWFRNFSVVDRAQFSHLLSAMTLPAVSVGIIPMTPELDHRPPESFEIFDGQQVNIEMLTGLLTLAYGDEVTAYVRA